MFISKEAVEDARRLVAAKEGYKDSSKDHYYRSMSRGFSGEDFPEKRENVLYTRARSIGDHLMHLLGLGWLAPV